MKELTHTQTLHSGKKISVKRYTEPEGVGYRLTVDGQGSSVTEQELRDLQCAITIIIEANCA